MIFQNVYGRVQKFAPPPLPLMFFEWGKSTAIEQFIKNIIIVRVSKWNVW